LRGEKFYDGVTAIDVIFRGPLVVVLALPEQNRGGKSPAIKRGQLTISSSKIQKGPNNPIQHSQHETNLGNFKRLVYGFLI